MKKKKQNTLVLNACVRVAASEIHTKIDYFVWSISFVGDCPQAGVKVRGLTNKLLLKEPILLNKRRAGKLYECEFELWLPYFVRSFTLECGGCVQKFSKRDCQTIINQHYDLINNALKDDNNEYSLWFEHQQKELSTQNVPESNLLISIVTPVFNPPILYLTEMINSVLSQTYQNWELIIVNVSTGNKEVAAYLDTLTDSRIEIIKAENKGIALNTNLGIGQAKGDYVAFLDHDDLISPYAIAEYVRVIESTHGKADLLYCDEDSLDERQVHFEPIFKPGWNFDLLCSNNYVLHWLMVSRKVLDATSRTTSVYDGAQDYDLTFKAASVARQIVHLPYVLYTWRRHKGSISRNPESKPYSIEAGRRAIQDNLRAHNLKVTVTPEEEYFSYKTIFSNSKALTCAITTSRDIQSWLTLEGDIVFYNAYDIQFSQNQIEIIAGYFNRNEVAAVSPRIIRADALIHYAGLTLSPEGKLLYLNRLLHKNCGGYVGRSLRPYDYLVLNPYCFALRKSYLQEALKTLNLKDDDFINSVVKFFIYFYKQGYRNIYTPFVEEMFKEQKSLIEDLFLQKQCTIEESFAYDTSGNENFDPRSCYYRLNIAKEKTNG